MQSLTVFEILKQVITSWQVIVITIALVFFLKLVFYVSRRYHRPLSIKKISFTRKKKKTVEQSEGPEEVISGSSDNDDLGLEEQ